MRLNIRKQAAIRVRPSRSEKVHFERLGKGETSHSKSTFTYNHGERGSSLPVLHSNACFRDFVLHGSGQKDRH